MDTTAQQAAPATTPTVQAPNQRWQKVVERAQPAPAQAQAPVQTTPAMTQAPAPNQAPVQASIPPQSVDDMLAVQGTDAMNTIAADAARIAAGNTTPVTAPTAALTPVVAPTPAVPPVPSAMPDIMAQIPQTQSEPAVAPIEPIQATPQTTPEPMPTAVMGIPTTPMTETPPAVQEAPELDWRTTAEATPAASVPQSMPTPPAEVSPVATPASYESEPTQSSGGLLGIIKQKKDADQKALEATRGYQEDLEALTALEPYADDPEKLLTLLTEAYHSNMSLKDYLNSLKQAA